MRENNKEDILKLGVRLGLVGGLTPTLEPERRAGLSRQSKSNSISGKTPHKGSPEAGKKLGCQWD